MSRRGAPTAFRSPISRVRSVTTISMMFMMTTPPTTSDNATTPMSTEKMPVVACEIEHGAGGEDAEVVLLPRREPPMDPERHDGLVHGLFEHRGIARPHHE